jgi:hypothetical protein
MPDITEEKSPTAIVFHALNQDVSKWMTARYANRYDSSNDLISFNIPAEKTAVEEFRRRAIAAGFKFETL